MHKHQYVLGVSAFYHDSAACLVRNGSIVSAAQEERFTRKKHDASFPSNAIEYCLNSAGISAGDLVAVAFYDKPLLKFERLLETYLVSSPLGLKSFLKAMPVWLKTKLWIPKIIENEIGYSGDLYFPEHHESHAASAFYPSPFQHAAILTMDGVGEWTTTSWGTGEDNQIKLKKEINFPHSLGLLYSAFTYYTGFKVNSGEYKLMGLAPYGEPKYVDQIRDNLIDIKSDGSYRLDMKYFNYAAGLTMTNRHFDKLFNGRPRLPESRISQREMDLAASIQQVTEEVILKTVDHIVDQTGMKNICLAGGVALNCVANGIILKSGLIDKLWIQPAAGDAGGAVGAAMAVWHHHLGNGRMTTGAEDAMQGAYLGPEFSDHSVQSTLDKLGAVYSRVDDPSVTGAGIISKEKVLGWFQGRMEFGPRALGNRSILGDARSVNMQTTMNLKIKYRESFRPFAPSVKEEEISKWFEIDEPSPYMLLVANVHNDHLLNTDTRELEGLNKLKCHRSSIPAITHVDNSARIQSVSKHTNPKYHALISHFQELTGCPVIVNTSFNVRGEPIVATPADAYRCFMATEMDSLIVGSFVMHKNDQPSINKENYLNEFDPD